MRLVLNLPGMLWILEVLEREGWGAEHLLGLVLEEEEASEMEVHFSLLRTLLRNLLWRCRKLRGIRVGRVAPLVWVRVGLEALDLDLGLWIRVLVRIRIRVKGRVEEGRVREGLRRKVGGLGVWAI